MARRTFNSGDIWRVLVESSSVTQRGINQFDFFVNGPVIGAIRDSDLATWFGANIAPNYKTLLYNSGSLDDIQVFRLYPVTSALDPTASPFITTAGSGPGSGGPNALPTQTAGIATFLVDERGRGIQGRKYIPFPSATANAATGLPTGAYTASVSGMLAPMFPAFSLVNGGSSCLLEPYVARVFRPTKTSPWELSARLAIGNLVHAKWATQRRRGSYGRPNP